jgi:thiol-disulfide isomerase/thioredoxin
MPSRRLLLQLLAAGALAAGMMPAVGAVTQPNAPVAPEFTGIDGWLNTAASLTLAGLRGKLVLVDFWTYSCINCRRTVPYLNHWQAEHGAHGLRVAGIHSPEFGFEHMRHDVADAMHEFGIRFPVGQDNDFRTWRAWGNEAWPAFYLLDRSGRVVLVRKGEGHARELEAAIVALLGLTPLGSVAVPGDDPDLSQIGTPKIYFGALHPTPQDRFQRPRQGEAAYAFPAGARGRASTSSTGPDCGRARPWCSGPRVAACGCASPRPSSTWLPQQPSRPRCASRWTQAHPTRSRSSGRRSTPCSKARAMASTCSRSKPKRRGYLSSAQRSVNGQATRPAPAQPTGPHDLEKHG